MLRMLIVATLLLLCSASGARAAETVPARAEGGEDVAEAVAIPLQIGAQAEAQTFLPPAIRAGLPSDAMQRSVNGVVQLQGAAQRHERTGAFFSHSDKPGLALPVSDSVSVGLRYQYLRPEDLRRAVADTATMDEQYRSHNLVVRARWQF